MPEKRSNMNAENSLEGRSTAGTQVDYSHGEEEARCTLLSLLFPAGRRGLEGARETWLTSQSPHPLHSWSLAADWAQGRCVHPTSFLFLQASGASPHPVRNEPPFTFKFPHSLNLLTIVSCFCHLIPESPPCPCLWRGLFWHLKIREGG